MAVGCPATSSRDCSTKALLQASSNQLPASLSGTRSSASLGDHWPCAGLAGTVRPQVLSLSSLDCRFLVELSAALPCVQPLETRV